MPRHIRRRLAAIFCLLAIWPIDGVLRPDGASATSIDPLDRIEADEIGEILEPSAPFQPIPLGNDEEPSALQSIPLPTIEMYESLDTDLDQNNPLIRESAGNVEAFTGLPDSMTALEWIQQWTDSGYWLENGQWADFRATALSSYAPEIWYWLGNDRWASFASSPLVKSPAKEFSNQISITDNSHDTNGPVPPAYHGVPESTSKLPANAAWEKEQQRVYSLKDFMKWLVSKIYKDYLLFVLIVIALTLLFTTIKLVRNNPRKP